jgi:hypothetical protein
MQGKDWISAAGILISTIIAICSWQFSRYKDREQEKFRLRLSKTEEIWQAFRIKKLSQFELVACHESWSETDRSGWRKEDNLKFQNLSILVQCFGNASIQNAFLKIEQAENEADKVMAMSNFENILIESLRSDMGYEPITYS